MPKKSTGAKGIERGDWLTLQVRVTSVWDDGMVTVEVGGQLVTIRQDSSMIVGLTKEKEPKQGKIGTSPLAKWFADDQ